jgi:hypothetical protein
MLIAKRKGRPRDFTFIPCPHTYINSLITNTSHPSGMIVTVDEPVLTNHNHPKSTGFIRVHSWLA